VERHLAERHANRPPWTIVVREPGDVASAASGAAGSASHLPWHCAMCKQVAASSTEMLAHLRYNHGIHR